MDKAHGFQLCLKEIEIVQTTIARYDNNGSNVKSWCVTTWSAVSAYAYGPHWLLSYEAKVQNWLGTVGGGDHVTADPPFNFLQSQGVRFYRRVRRPTSQTAAMIPNWRPEYSDQSRSEKTKSRGA